MADFRFIEETHEYFLGDRRMESVTEILGEAGMTDYRFSREWYMTRGKYIHAATEFIDRGSLDWEGLDPELTPFCKAYQSFIEDKRPEIILSEKPLYHAQHLFAGTFDRLVKMDGATAIIDIKSGVPSPSAAIQVAAYRELVKVSEGFTEAQLSMNLLPTKCFSLHLRDDGAYRLTEHRDFRKNFNVFLAALTVVRWRKGAA